MIGYWECGLMAFDINYGISDTIVVGYDVDHQYELEIQYEDDRAYILCDDAYYLDECMITGGIL